MQLEGRKIEVGATLFYPKATAVGTKLKPGEVCAVYEFCKAVKVRFVVSGTKMKSAWFPVKDLKWKE